MRSNDFSALVKPRVLGWTWPMHAIVWAISFLVAALPRLVQAAPNVILIMADDLGYHDLACYGHPEIKTPVLDRLANEGIRLTNFYAGATVCTPSRMALLTGAYPSRLGWEKGVVGYLMKRGEGLNPDALTIAEVLRDHGYRTGISGKWHLGEEPPFRPHRQGFEETYYLSSSNNLTKKIMCGDEVVEDPFDNRLLTEQFTREAIRFIEKHRSEPFFLYLPYTAPHFPVEAHPDWKGRSSYGVFGDVVEEMDHRIGEVLGALDRLDIAHQTIVVFLSDNGPEPNTKASLAKPLRGTKWTALEGGTRVPCILRFPGILPAGRVTDDLTAAIDLLPTLCRACGIDPQTIGNGTPRIDGLDLWASLCEEAGAENPRKDLLYWHGKEGFQAIRVGEWKLFPDGEDALLPAPGTGPALFNLADENDEMTNLSARFPEKVAAMQELAEGRLADIREDSIPLGMAETAPPKSQVEKE